MKVIILTDDEYEILLSELQDLVAYKWNDDKTHSEDCYSKSLIVVEQNTYERERCSEG